MRRISKLTVIGFGALGLLGAGVTYAAWTANGTGSGTAKAITAQAVTLAGGANTPQLYPGGDGDVVVVVTNPNPYPVLVTAYNGNGTITSDKGAACNASTGVTFTNVSGRTDAVAANDTTTVTLTNAAHMSNASDNSCQDAVFTIPLSAVAASNAP